MWRVQIVQPIVPHYRVPFFSMLAARRDIKIFLDTSDALPGDSSIVPATLPAPVSVTTHKCRSILGGRFFWQERIRLNPELQKGDVLVVNGNPRFLSNFPLILDAKRRGIGTVWWGQGWGAESRPFRAAIRRRLMRLADVLLLYTDREVGEFTKLGFSEDRVFAINNTIDQAPIGEARAAWDSNRLSEFREANQLYGKKLLLFCGRLTRKAHLELALEAVSHLARYGQYELAIIGDGDEAVGLRKLARQLEVDQRTRWLGPMIEQSRLAPWFLSADCFVYPGAIGLSLLHAFGYGLPVITHSTLRRQMPEIAALEHLKNGYLFKENDVFKLVEGVRYICEDSVRRHQLSEAATRTAAKYSIEHMVERLVLGASVASQLAASR